MATHSRQEVGSHNGTGCVATHGNFAINICMPSFHVLNIPVQERIQLTFGVVNSEGENILVHQAFVR